MLLILMDKHTLLQRFPYLTSLASLAYTFTTLHTIQYAMRDHDNDTITQLPQGPQPDHDATNPSASSSAPRDTSTTTGSASENLEKTSRWTENEIKLLLDYVEGHCVLTTARGLSLKKADFNKARTVVKSKDASQCHYKWSHVRIFIINVRFHRLLSITAMHYIQSDCAVG